MFLLLPRRYISPSARIYIHVYIYIIIQLTSTLLLSFWLNLIRRLVNYIPHCQKYPSLIAISISIFQPTLSILPAKPLAQFPRFRGVRSQKHYRRDAVCNDTYGGGGGGKRRHLISDKLFLDAEKRNILARVVHDEYMHDPPPPQFPRYSNQTQEKQKRVGR